MKNKILSLLSVGLLFGATSCDNYLDTMPDNRTEIDSEEKVAKLLVSAYPDNHPNIILEFSSDNVDDYNGEENPNSARFPVQVAYWEDITESDNDGPSSVWEAYYGAIKNANAAIEAINEMGNPANLNQYKGEALVARAYCHFMLASTFCDVYNPSTAEQVLGIPYMDHSETELDPKYERGTLANVYEKIDADLQEGLPLCGDNYTVPKYHFNRLAAYGFASRFYLFYLKYDKVIECADKCFGSNPAPFMRDWAAIAQKTYSFDVYSQDYINASNKCNFILATGVSSISTVFGPYTKWKRFSLTPVTDQEVLVARAPWGSYTTNTYYYSVKNYLSTGSYSFHSIAKFPYLFEYTDAVAGIGYTRSIFPLIQAEEVLLNRAEAYALTNKFDEAVADLVTWQKSRIKSGTTMTLANINSFFSGLAYYEPMTPTIKHKLNPQGFTVTDAQENLIHCILHVRRIQTISEGLRWFDIKRYGIDVYRRLINRQGALDSVTASLLVGDKRRAIQLPSDVIAAGLEKNPR